MSEFDVDVMIVGCGPTAMVLANLLGQSGVKALIVERSAGISNLPRAVSLDDEGMRTLQATGLLEIIAPHMVIGYAHRIIKQNGATLMAIDPKDKEFGHPKRNRFHQPELEAYLVEGLARFPNVSLAYETTLVDLAVGPDDVAATLEHGGARRTVRARYLVGCDGGNSAVRRLLGIAMQGKSNPEPWIVIDTDNNPDTSRFSRMIADPRRPNVNVASLGGRRRYEFMLLPGEDEAAALTDESIQRLIGPHCDLAGVRIDRRAVYQFHSLLADRFSEGGRVFLAGDAAHMMPPFGCQGMNSGVRDAFNLAWKLTAVLQGRLGEGLLDSYDSERRPHAADMILFSDRMGKIYQTRNRAFALLRNVAFWVLLRIPASADYLRNMRFKPKPTARNGFFVADAGNLPGRMFPQPDIVTTAGRREPLDAVLGSGFALLHVSDLPNDHLLEFTHPLWKRLGARRVAVLPGALSKLPEGADAVVSDIAGVIADAVNRHEPVTVLLRPDRYVAAVIAPGRADDMARALEALAPLASQA